MAVQMADQPMISVSNLVISYGDHAAVKGISFDVRRGEHVTLLGPSGCGKTTTLRGIAGLEHPSGGAIMLDGKTVYSATQRISMPAEKRGVSMVFQSYAIWPHMTVFENVAYGLRVRRVAEKELQQRANAALELVQLRHVSDRPASNLSGGQQQRVALGRAIAFSPTIILFDEPLSNLDAKLRASMRVELRDLQQKLGISSVYVTHDQEEALAISDRVIVMNDGKIEQIGSPEDIYKRPASSFVADFVGAANLLPGKAVTGERGDGELIFELTSGERLRMHGRGARPSNVVKVAVRTALIDIHSGRIEGGDRNALQGTVLRKVFLGDFVEYLVRCGDHVVTVRRPPTETLGEGAGATLLFSVEDTVPLER